MKVLDYFRIALININRKAIRSLFTILGIFIAATFIMYMFSAINLLNTISNGYKVNSFENVITVSEKTDGIMNPNVKKLNDRNLKVIENLKGVEKTSQSIDFYLSSVKYKGKFISGNFNIKGYNLDNGLCLPIYKDEVKPIVAGHKLLNKDSSDILINEKVLSAFCINNPEEALGKDITIDLDNINGVKVNPYIKTFKIVGVINKNLYDSADIYMSDKNASDIMGFMQRVPDFLSNFGYEEEQIQVSNTSNVKKIQSELNNLGFTSFSQVSSAISMKNKFERYERIILFVLVALIFMSCLGIVNTLGMSVKERCKSIGLMKALGATKKNICIIFLIESASIGILASIFAIIMYNLTFYNIFRNIAGNAASHMNSASVMPFYFNFVLIISITLICGISGVYPAILASKLDPVEALNK